MKHAGRAERKNGALSGRIREVVSGISPGAAPGSVRTRPDASPSVVTVTLLRDGGTLERANVPIEDAIDAVKRGGLSWIHVDGLGDADVVGRLMSEFGLHPLAIEDTMNPHQRPRLDDYGEFLFMSLRLPESDGFGGHSGQLSLFVLRETILSFREGGDPAPILAVRERLRKEAFTTRVQGCGSDFLAYSLLDAVVDFFYVALERAGERLESLENEILAAPGPAVVSEIRGAKRDLLSLRRAIWPLRDVVSELQRTETPLVTGDTRVYLPDCLDHVLQILDLLETYRDTASGLMDVHLATVSNRMNEIMKILTIISTIFIPLTFIAGLYGMNFNTQLSPLNMPELNWKYGYLFALALMLVSAAGMAWMFRKKGWIGSTRGSAATETVAKRPPDESL